MESVKEVIEYIQPNQRNDIVQKGLDIILGLTGNEDNHSALLHVNELFHALFELTQDKRIDIAKQALSILINISAKEDGANKMLQASKYTKPVFELITIAIDKVVDPHCELADIWSMLWNNLTRFECLVEETISVLEADCSRCIKLAEAFSNPEYNEKEQCLDYLALIFCNITQTGKGRDLFCCNLYTLMDEFLPHVKALSKERSRGTIGFLKNICFDDKYHDFIFDEEYNALPTLLYMLCGPEKNNGDFQTVNPILYNLPNDKKPEEDPELRLMILEALLQLCSDRVSRSELKDNGVYEILRDYHKWELEEGKNNECLLACEKVVDILIKNEDEIGIDNYRDVEIPADVLERFTAANSR